MIETKPDRVNHSVEAAKDCGFSASRPDDRAALLLALAAELARYRAELVEVAEIETGLSLARLNGELDRTVWQLTYFAERIGTPDFPPKQIDNADDGWPAGGRPRLFRTARPIGPVVVFSASNFPFAFSVLGTDTASALAAGCPVIVKAHPGHPRLSSRVFNLAADVLRAGGWPQPTLAIIFGEKAGIQALEHPDVKAAAFTGSTQVGRSLFNRAAARSEPIPFYGELGSRNPVFVTQGALAARRDSIIDGAVTSVTGSVGQLCTKPGLIFLPPDDSVERDIANRFDSLEPQPMLNERIVDGYIAATSGVLGSDGVRTLLAPITGSRQGAALAAIDIEDFFVAGPQLHQECFGPFAILVRYSDPGQLLVAATGLEGQLTASVHSEPNEAGVHALVDALADRAGRIIQNGWPTGLAVTDAMTHGGPYPATTAPLHTSVGVHAIDRFLRPITYQNFPAALLS